MAKKKNSRAPRNKKTANKRWMRTVSGFSTLKSVSLFVFGIGFLALAAVSVWYVKSQNVEFTPLPTITHTTKVPDTGEVLNLINAQRQANGRPELQTNDKLKAVAERRLKEMVNSQQYSHKNLDGKYYYDLLREHEYFSDYSCENLDIENTVTPSNFIESWLTSDGGHRECLLNNDVSHVGIASGSFSLNDDKSSSYLVVAIFASEPAETIGN